MVDKGALMEKLLASLASQVEAARAAADEARRAATHEEARPENDKDTRGLEQSYLARGQAMRVEELEEAVTRLRFFALRAFREDDPIAPGALVTLASDGPTGERVETLYFVVPTGGGAKLTVDGVEVQLVTPAAPLGRALIDKHVGDEVTLRAGGRPRELEIVRVE